MSLIYWCSVFWLLCFNKNEFAIKKMATLQLDDRLIIGCAVFHSRKLRWFQNFPCRFTERGSHESLFFMQKIKRDECSSRLLFSLRKLFATSFE